MAEKSEIIDAIQALAVHCRPALMSVEAQALWMRDWCTDLAEFPLDAITNACRKWRHSGATKFPTAGQLLPMVRESLPAQQGEGVEVWRPLSDAEYQQLTVREKIRHQLILAHEATGKAGAMFRNTCGGIMGQASGVHLLPEEMPESWSRWMEIGGRHAAEAKRLREYLNSPRPQAAAQ